MGYNGTKPHPLKSFWDKYRAMEEVARLSAIEIKNSYCETLWEKEQLHPEDLNFRCGKCRICRIKSALAIVFDNH